MSEKNTLTLIIASLIGAIGVILAACIGLIPTILPLVRPSATPLVFVTATFTPSNTPLPETPSATSAPTEVPSPTATLSPQETPTETQTTVPTPVTSSSDVDDYVGTWTNVDSDPSSEKVKLILTRIEISKSSETTADFSVCRAVQDAEEYVQPNPAQAYVYVFGLAARDLFISELSNLRWAIVVQRSGDELVATVQEYDTSNVLLNSDTFRLTKANLLNSLGMQPCENPPTPIP